jgi:uncharacterized protein with PhoU and TrkA domain
MNHPNQKALNDFLQEFPRNQIIDTLNTIDKKIGSLHTISSKDFLYFNKLLKEYYKHVKTISEANNNMADFFNKDLQEITERLKEKNLLQKKSIDDVKLKTLKVNDLLTITFSSFDLLIVPFNNYKQNLITLKYLLANLKLHLTYIDLANKPELQQSVTLLEKSIDSIHAKFEAVGNDSDDLNNKILHLKDTSSLTKSLERTDAVDQLKNVANDIKKLSFEEYWPDNFMLDLNRRTQNCFANMGEIITNIQYHDIIRQKMEHIQLSQKELVKGLSDLEIAEFPEKYLEDQLNFVAKIPEIADIQVAQLLYTNKDYQTSIEKITSKLIEVGHEMKELNNIYLSLLQCNNQFEDTFMDQINESQKLYGSFMIQLAADWQKSTTVFGAINNLYVSLKQKFGNIFESEKSLRNEVRNFEKLLKANGQNFGIELMSRLMILLTELQLNSNSLKNNLNNITQHVASLNKLFSTFQPDAKNQDLGDDALKELTQKLTDVKKIAKDHGKISIGISEEITSSLKNIEYYHYFKQTVEEIVNHLNDINKKVNYDKLKTLVADDSELIKKLEKMYTMKSERDIHQQALEFGSSNIGITDEQNSSSFEDDIELF